jgi:thiol-disulfide isomerase/thioredoxin
LRNCKETPAALAGILLGTTTTETCQSIILADFDLFWIAMRFLLGLLLMILPLLAGAKATLKEGDLPPDDLAQTVSGENIRVSDYQGKIVIATFWASWCAPCRQEISVLAKVREKVSSEKLAIVAINFGEERQVFVKASKLLAGTGITITHDRRLRLSTKLGIRSIPYMLMIDHNGRIKHIHSGFGDQSLDVLVAEINAMLKAQYEAEQVAPIGTSGP